MMTSAHEFRIKCRNKLHTTHTSNICTGYAQANLIVLPKEAAKDFENLCLRNPVPCPLIAKTLLGNPKEIDNKCVILHKDFDITTDIPKYNIYENGKLVETKLDIKDEWTEDHVAFLIGCSFSFEKALSNHRFTPKNIIENSNVSMYETTRYLHSAGIFKECTYVVSMRPYKLKDIDQIRSITSAFRKCHGEPLDWGYDAVKRLGIKDLNKPEFGDPIKIEADEIPVFWGCGVTPQLAVKLVADKIKGKVMSHVPGHMLVLDIEDDAIIML